MMRNLLSFLLKLLQMPSDHGKWTFFFSLTIFLFCVNFFLSCITELPSFIYELLLLYCYYIHLLLVIKFKVTGELGPIPAVTGHQPVTGLILITCFNSLFLDDRVSCTQGSKAMLNHDSPFILGFMVLILVMVCLLPL